MSTNNKTLRGPNARGNLDNVPFTLTEADQLKAKQFAEEVLAQTRPAETCIFCGEPVECSPMIRKVCYGCYRSRIVFIGAHNAHELNGVTK